MSEVEKELAELRALIIAQQKETLESKIDSSGKVLKWLQSIIAIVVVVVGVGINWGVTKSEITSLKTQVVELKEARAADEALNQATIDKLKTEMIETKLKQAAVDQVLTDIREDVSEIKDDVKKLMRGR